MKKFFVFLLGILLLGGLLVSCSEGEDEEEEYQLGYYQAGGKIYLAVPHKDKTLYIKIFRLEGTDNIYNIGEIIPTLINKSIAYTFEDELVSNSQTYKYLAVYYMLGDFFVTDWTDEIKVLGSSFDSDPLPYVDVNAYFLFNSDNMRLTLKDGDIGFTDPETDSEDSSDSGTGTTDTSGTSSSTGSASGTDADSSSGSTTAGRMTVLGDMMSSSRDTETSSSASSDTSGTSSDTSADSSTSTSSTDSSSTTTTSTSFYRNYSVNLCIQSASNSTLLKLTKKLHRNYTKDEFLVMDSALPNEFIGTPLKLVGAVYQKVDVYPQNVDDALIQYKCVHWSKPKAIKLQVDGKAAETFTVYRAASAENGYDYSAPIENKTN